MVKKFRFVASLLVLFFPMLAAAQTQVKKVPAKRTPASSGEAMYKEYCASCHGLSGKGDGPAAPAMKTPPADLTTLSARNGGQFPDTKVVQALKAGPEIPAHGSAEMPVWGRIFSKMGTAPNDAEIQLRIHNLSEYLKTLQAK